MPPERTHILKSKILTRGYVANLKKQTQKVSNTFDVTFPNLKRKKLAFEHHNQLLGFQRHPDKEDRELKKSEKPYIGGPFTTLQRQMIEAVMTKNAGSFQNLLDKASDHDREDWQVALRVSLNYSIIFDNPSAVKKLIENGVLDSKLEKWQPPIFIATSVKNADIATILLNHYSKADITKNMNSDNGNLLHAAIMCQSIKLVRQVCDMFLKFGVSLNCKTTNGENSILHTAVHYIPTKKLEKVEVAKPLKRKLSSLNVLPPKRKRRGVKSSIDETDENMKEKKDEITLDSNIKELNNLRRSLSLTPSTQRNTEKYENDLEILTYLLSLDLDINAQNSLKSTPLHEAVKLGLADACQLLLKHNANPQLPDIHKNTALMSATQFCNNSVLDAFSSHEKTLHSIQNGETWLHYACSWGNLNAVKHLIQKGISPKAQNASGYTPLMVAVENKNLECVKYILENTSSGVNIVSDDNMHALLKALENLRNPLYFPYYGPNAFLDALYKGGADVNIKDNDGFTPILKSYEDENAWNWLIKHGADLNVVTNNGQNILHLAVQQDNTILVGKFLHNNFDVRKLSKCPLLPGGIITPIVTAIQNKNVSLCCFLIDMGVDCYGVKKWLKDNHTIYEELKVSKMIPILNRIELEWGQVTKLKDLARHAILNTLGHYEVQEKIDKLTLPPLLIEYMKWHNVLEIRNKDWFG